MNTDYKDRKYRSKNFIHSFSYALKGIILAILRERNLKIDLFITVLVVFFGFFLRISLLEWAVILLAIAGVITAELVNTAIERVVDLVTIDFHPLAKEAKDIAAGAVLFFAFICAVVGLIIFLPKLWFLFAG